MKKILLLTSLFVSTLGFSQTTLFQDSFDSYNDFVITGFGQWRTLDLDLLYTYTTGTNTPMWANYGQPQAFQIFNPTTALVSSGPGDCNTTENLNFSPRTGAKYAACWGAAPETNGQTATANNDWLISPPINLAGASNTQLSFWYKSLSDCYGPEFFKIGVYIGSGNPTQSSDFTIISPAPYIESINYTTWTERIQALNTYNGQTIRIGINCVSEDILMLMIDDFKVTATTMSTTDFVSDRFAVYPNPTSNIVTISNGFNIQIKKIAVSDVNGRTVKTVDIYGTSGIQLDVSELKAGVYFLSIDTVEGVATKRIIKT